MHITIFTVSVADNNYLDTPLCKFCMSSWPKLVKKLESKGYTADIHIYKYNDPEVLAYKEECKDLWDNSSTLSRLADGFRMYMLSRYPNHIWLDTDVYISDEFNFVDKYFFTDNWAIIYNKDNLEPFKLLYEEWYKNTNNVDHFYLDWRGPMVSKYEMNDRSVHRYFNLPAMNKNDWYGAIHLSWVNNFDPRYRDNRVIFYRDIADFDPTWKEQKKLFIALNDSAYSHIPTEVPKSHRRNLKGELEVINFIADNFFPKLKEML